MPAEDSGWEVIWRVYCLRSNGRRLREREILFGGLVANVYHVGAWTADKKD